MEQNQTGIIVHSKQEFKVSLFNACPCLQTNIILNCTDFKSAEKIEPNILVINGSKCSLPKGTFIPPFTGYVFSYAWDSRFPFKPLSSKSDC